jgi:hypothetical protein
MHNWNLRSKVTVNISRLSNKLLFPGLQRRNHILLKRPTSLNIKMSLHFCFDASQSMKWSCFASLDAIKVLLGIGRRIRTIVRNKFMIQLSGNVLEIVFIFLIVVRWMSWIRRIRNLRTDFLISTDAFNEGCIWNHQYQFEWNASTNGSGPRMFRLCLKKIDGDGSDLGRHRQYGQVNAPLPTPFLRRWREMALKWRSQWSIMTLTIFTRDIGYAGIWSKIRLIYSRQAWQLCLHISNLPIESKTLRIPELSDGQKRDGKADLRSNGTLSGVTERLDPLCQWHGK